MVLFFADFNAGLDNYHTNYHENGKEFEPTTKTLIIYTSQTGFTKRYAEWIAEKMASSYDISDVKYIEPIVAYLAEKDNEKAD